MSHWCHRYNEQIRRRKASSETAVSQCVRCVSIRFACDRHVSLLLAGDLRFLQRRLLPCCLSQHTCQMSWLVMNASIPSLQS
jgi:hypothetical protein